MTTMPLILVLASVVFPSSICAPQQQYQNGGGGVNGYYPAPETFRWSQWSKINSTPELISRADIHQADDPTLQSDVSTMPYGSRLPGSSQQTPDLNEDGFKSDINEKNVNVESSTDAIDFWTGTFNPKPSVPQLFVSPTRNVISSDSHNAQVFIPPQPGVYIEDHTSEQQGFPQQDGTFHYSSGLIPEPPFYRKYDVLIADSDKPTNLSRLLEIPPEFSHQFMNFFSPESIVSEATAHHFHSEDLNEIAVPTDATPLAPSISTLSFIDTVSTDGVIYDSSTKDNLISDQTTLSNTGNETYLDDITLGPSVASTSHQTLTTDPSINSVTESEMTATTSKPVLYRIASSPFDIQSNENYVRIYSMPTQLLNYILQRENGVHKTSTKLDQQRSLMTAPCIDLNSNTSKCNETATDFTNIKSPLRSPKMNTETFPISTNLHQYSPITDSQFLSPQVDQNSVEDAVQVDYADDNYSVEYYDDAVNPDVNLGPTEVKPKNPYLFGYEIRGKNGTDQYRREMSDLNGVVHGSYGYRDPVGMYRKVSYIADENGFRAHIQSNEPGMANHGSANVMVDVKPPPYEALFRSRQLANASFPGT